jgi:nucleoside-diphosphate-sugar epimerase
MNHRVLITGSSGLVGSAVARTLEQRGVDVVRFDLRGHGDDQGDVRDRDRVAKAVADVAGVIHLAAVSRVLWGERDPDGCWATNVGGTRNVLELSAKTSARPWIVFVSSREVYGQPDVPPATETTPLRPVNIYGRSKAEGERLVEEAQRAGVRACTIRLSNVFGSVADHPDRVVPAFVRGALASGELRVDGADHTFDFTFIDDVARGISSVADLLGTGVAAPPPIHFVSGRATTLGELAALAIELAGTKATVSHAPPRAFDVARFVGDGARARQLLDWQPRVDLREGLTRLLRALREDHEPIGAAARTEAAQ